METDINNTEKAREAINRIKNRVNLLVAHYGTGKPHLDDMCDDPVRIAYDRVGEEFIKLAEKRQIDDFNISDMPKYHDRMRGETAGYIYARSVLEKYIEKDVDSLGIDATEDVVYEKANEAIEKIKDRRDRLVKQYDDGGPHTNGLCDAMELSIASLHHAMYSGESDPVIVAYEKKC